MTTLAPLGRLFFAVALAAFGVQQFIVRDFVAGRAPAWPASTPGGPLWAYLTGAWLIAAAIAIVSGTRARAAAIGTGALIAGWALLRHIPLAAADPTFGGEWTAMGKALALAGGACAVAGSLPPDRRGGKAEMRGPLLALGRYGLAAFLMFAGLQHFMFAGFVQSLVPAWVPWHLFWTYFAGGALIAGGAGMIVPRTATLAASLSGLMVFLWVIMLHIPRALAAAPDMRRNEWTAVFEALAFSGLAFLLAGTPASDADRRSAP